MPLIKVVRKGITPHVRRVPTSTCAAIKPLTLDRVAREVGSETEEPAKVESLQGAFDTFKPSMQFVGRAGEEETEFRAEFHFRSIKDFEPENLQKRQEIRGEDGETRPLRNDVADLKNHIDLLYRLKDRWKLPTVRRAWSNPEHRREIIGALGRLRQELETVAGGAGN